MKAHLLLAVAAAVLPSPVLAQHDEHGAHAQGSQTTQEGGDHSAHAGEPMPADPHAGHATPAAEPKPPEQPASPPDAHAGHGAAPGSPASDHPAVEAASPPIAGPPPEAFSGPEFAADRVYGETAMALARRGELGAMHGGVKTSRVLIDRLEAHVGEGPDRYRFDGQAWYGGDIDKLWLKAEGEGAFGGAFEGAQLQALWSHAIGPWFDLQTGVRYDAGPGDDRGHIVLGVQGLAPYWIEVDTAAFLSDQGDVTARIEAEHDMRITQRLILQPRAEVDFALQDLPAQRIGSGLSTAAIGARLRYQVTQLFAPYIGIEYETAVGDTRDFRRVAGEDLGGVSFLAGVRTWF